MSKESEKGDFKRADEIKRRRSPAPVDLSIIDDAPTRRKERIDYIYAVIVDGENQFGGYNLQKLISKFVMVFGASRKTVVDYFETLERAGYIYPDNHMKIRDKKKDST